MPTPDARYVYLCFDGMPPTVFDSQVLGFIKMMQAQGVVFDLFIFEGLRVALKNRTYNSERLAALRGQMQGKVSYIPLGTRFGFPVAASLFLSLLAPDLAAGRKLFMHCRGYRGAYFSALLKKLTHKVFTVYDVRGDAEAELKFYLQGEENVPLWKRYEPAMQRRMEGTALRKADHVLCVSSPLRDRLRERWSLEDKPMDVVPCCADPKMFRFDPLARDRIRREHGLEDKFVLVFSGSTYKWQLGDKVVDMVKHLLPSIPNAHLLFLTPDVADARRILGAALPESVFTLKHVPHSRIPEHLAAADLGLLIREDHPLNRVACPTKFAEYAMSGLPVLITKGLGDLDTYVAQNKLGVVVQSLDELNHIGPRLQDFIADAGSPAWRERTATLALDTFAWDAYAPRLKAVYDRGCQES